MPHPENMGMYFEFYENILNLMGLIAGNMTTKEDYLVVNAVQEMSVMAISSAIPESE